MENTSGVCGSARSLRGWGDVHAPLLQGKPWGQGGQSRAGLAGAARGPWWTGGQAEPAALMV